MSLGPLVEIPPGYCFLPSCDPKPTSTSSPFPTHSLTTSTTTIFGPTFTAPTPLHPKRSASIIPMLGHHPMQAFPTDHPIKVGNGPICLVLCEWARTQSGETGTNPNPDPKPALRPISDGITTSTMVSVRRSTMTAPEEEGIRTSDIVASILKSVTEVPGPGPKTTTGPFPSSSSSPTFSPTHSPISFPQHHRRPPASQISIFVIGGIVGLALLLGAAWLITRQIRRVKARLNVHTQGVHRDREREVFENEGGKGVPELGRRGVGSLAKGEGERV